MAAKTLTVQPRSDEVSKLEKMISGCKVGATEAERKEYIESWVNLAKSEGIGPDVVDLLFKGFSVAEAEPLYRYVLETNSHGVYGRLFLSSKAQEDKVAAMRLALSLLAYELIQPTSDDSVDFVARRFNGFVISRNNRPHSALKSSVGALLVRPISKASISEKAHIESSRASSLANYLRPSLDVIISKRGTRPDDIRAAEELIDWLDKQKVVIAIDKPVTPDSTATESKDTALNPSECSMPNARSDKPVDTPTSSEPLLSDDITDGVVTSETASGNSEPLKPNGPTKSGSTVKSEKIGSSKTVKGKAGGKDSDLDMPAVIAFLSKLQKDHDDMEGQLESIRSERIEMSSKAIALEQKLRAAQREIEDLKDYRSTLSGNYSALQQQCEALKAENQSIRNELDDANEMIAMMDEGATHEADAALVGLGRELSYDYRKYLAAADQPMTEELGSIVLGQLRTVFEILKSHGIDLQ